MTRSTDPAVRDPAQETEYVRKLLLGLMSTLESKGLMTETEIGVILRAAHQAVYTPQPAPASAVPAPESTANLQLDFTLD